MRNNNLSSLSDKLVEIVFDNYVNNNNYMGIFFLLLGKLQYKLEAFPGAGHNYYEILNSIYKYARKNPSLNMKKIFEFSMSTCIDKFCLPEDFSLIMNYIFAQLDNESKNISPFRIDLINLLKKLESRINSYENFKNDKHFIEQVKQSDKYLNEKYGQKIL